MSDATYALASLAECGVTLYDCEHATPPDEGEGFPYLAIPNLKGGRVDLEGVRRINAAQLAKWNRRVTPQGGDIIMTRRGRVGDTAVVPDGLECTIGQNLVILRSESDVVDQGFLRWALRGPLYDSEVQRLLNVGAVFDSLNCADIPKIRIPLPSLGEQRAIAGVMGALDDKVESNRRIVNSCTQLARLLASGGPDQVRVGDVASVEKGLSYKGAGLADSLVDALPMINLGNFSTSGWLNGDGLKPYTGSYRPRHLVHAGDLIVANTDLTQQRVILGRPALVPCHLEQALFTHHVFAVRTDDPRVRIGLWAQLNSTEFRERAEGYATGTTVASMPSDAVLDFVMWVPSESTVAEVEYLLRRAWSAERESLILGQLRDALLPELLSGRLRVRGVKHVGAGVA